MEKLIKRMLSVGSRLTEDDRSGNVIHRFAESVDRLAV